jgi:hypothetical protein
MRLHVKQHVLDYEGKPLLRNKIGSDGSVVLGENNRPVQEQEELRSYLVIALNNQAQGENEVATPEQLSLRYQISNKLYPAKGNETDLTHKECAFIQERAGKVYANTPLIYGRICDILEEREPELPEENEEPISQAPKSKAGKSAAADGGE